MTHQIHTHSTREALHAECRCGASFQSTGHDESSRTARAGWVRQHTKENR